MVQIDLQHEASDLTGTVELACVKNREGAVFNGVKFRFFDQGAMVAAQDCSEALMFECLEDNVTAKDKKSDLKVKMLKALADGEKNLSSLFGLVKGDRKLYDDTLAACIEGGLIKERTGAKNSRIFNMTSDGTTFLAYNDESDSTNEK